MPGKPNASKKKQQLKRNPKRKIDDEEAELSEKEVRNIAKNNKQPKHLSSEVTGKTEHANLKQIKIASNKRKTWQPLSKKSREHLQTMMESVIVSVLSSTVKENEQIQYHLNYLKKRTSRIKSVEIILLSAKSEDRNRLLQLCETLKVPPKELRHLSNVSNALKMEKAQHKANEEGLALLQEEVDKMVETTESMTENIQSLKNKIQILTTEVEEEEEKVKQMLQMDHSGVLCLPELSQNSLKAPILQEEILTLIPNQNALLKDLDTLHNSSQMKNMLTFIQEAYNKLDTS
ncbi:centromere protein Q isoform X2 [Elephas maximus indicus]|uniref:centromere protein Q isoform X2 n=1 Tax=Elephas maximus indicus TaxID=99487 RepID=UPI002116DAED|nr:centromere protein Q isoform X2 [Elephas maximus indicus]